MKILIIEDEFNLADVISSRLQKENYLVDITLNGEEGLYQALSNVYDLIILDVMLPIIDGFEVLKRLRKENIQSKIIILTAKDMLEDKLNGLKNGANDYLTKPFHIDELVARINIQLNNVLSKEKITFEDLELNIKNYKLTCLTTKESINLVCKEYQILEYLINNHDQILSKMQIYDRVWGIDNEIESNNLEAYLSFLRKKLKAIGSSVNIKAYRSLGYKLEKHA